VVNVTMVRDNRSGPRPAGPVGECAREHTVDGHAIDIRPVTPEDVPALVRLHAELSDESIYLRFFGFSRSAAATFASHLVDPADPARRAVAAWSDGTLVGVANYARVGPDSAELAVLVADGWHERGIGTLLVRHLAAIALDQGIRTFQADVLSDNHLALRLVRDAGYPLDATFGSGVVRFVVHLDRPPPAAGGSAEPDATR
jgi:GNAT superfamily N-acetyltransferase